MCIMKKKTPWCSWVLEKFTVTQLFRKFLPFMKPNSHHRILPQASLFQSHIFTLFLLRSLTSHLCVGLQSKKESKILVTICYYNWVNISFSMQVKETCGFEVLLVVNIWCSSFWSWCHANTHVNRIFWRNTISPLSGIKWRAVDFSTKFYWSKLSKKYLCNAWGLMISDSEVPPVL